MMCGNTYLTSRKMDRITDSDVTMYAINSFNQILQQVQDSHLNYKIKITPYSAVVSIKK